MKQLIVRFLLLLPLLYLLILQVIRTDAQGQNIDPNKAPSELQRVAEYLVNKENLKVREGVFHGNRIEYFKGKFHFGYCDWIFKFHSYVVINVFSKIFYVSIIAIRGLDI
jgi:hypothetical protein